jgi:hypothetical protein
MVGASLLATILVQTFLGETLSLLVIPARRFTTAEWLVKPESISILFHGIKGKMDPGVCRGDENCG